VREVVLSQRFQRLASFSQQFKFFALTRVLPVSTYVNVTERYHKRDQRSRFHLGDSAVEGTR
jgi:hypothetical protein